MYNTLNHLLSMHMCNCILTFEFHTIFHSLSRIAQRLFLLVQDSDYTDFAASIPD